MKIIVSSEKEKVLLNKFVEFMQGGGIDDIEDIFQDEQYGFNISSSDISFLTSGFNGCVVEIGKTSPLTIDDSEVTGICGICGEVLSGTIDGDDLSMDEYEDFKELCNSSNVRCEDCFRSED